MAALTKILLYTVSLNNKSYCVFTHGKLIDPRLSYSLYLGILDSGSNLHAHLQLDFLLVGKSLKSFLKNIPYTIKRLKHVYEIRKKFNCQKPIDYFCPITDYLLIYIKNKLFTLSLRNSLCCIVTSEM